MPRSAPRRARVRERPRLRALAALVASVALNALVLSWLAAAGALPAPRRAERTAVALAPVEPRAWAENRQVRPEPRPGGRVVEQPPERVASDRPPERSRFLSDRDVRVERETVSRDAGRYLRPAPRPERGAPGARAGAAARAARRSPDPIAGGPGRAGEDPGRLSEGLVLPPSPGGDHAAGEGRRSARPEGGGGGPPPAPGAPGNPPDLRPSPGSLARIAGGPSMDGYREAEEDDATSLSSREFRFATFLNQMRSAIGAIWYPAVEAAIREHDPEGSAVFCRERTVVLHLTLGPTGDLRSVSVRESSRVAFVDEVAVSAVRRAQPFANPPRAMFGPDGEVRVPFAFTVFPFERRGVVRWRSPVGR